VRLLEDCHDLAGSAVCPEWQVYGADDVGKVDVCGPTLKDSKEMSARLCSCVNVAKPGSQALAVAADFGKGATGLFVEAEYVSETSLLAA
jgi:hypothetical protein